jgi:hypothetical protein
VPTNFIRCWLRHRLLFAFRHAGRYRFPAFQFANGVPKAVIGRVIGLIYPMDGWVVMYWFAAANGWLDEGASPVSVLDTDPNAVLIAASHANDLISDCNPTSTKIDRYLAPIGWLRLTGEVERQYADAPLPPDIRDRIVTIKLRSRLPRTMLAEGDGFRADLSANRSPPTLGALPLVVISEGKPDDPFMQSYQR